MYMRVTVRPTGDRTEDLRIAERARRDIFSHAPVEVGPDNPIRGINRDESGRAYFEFSTEHAAPVSQVVKDYGHEGRVDLAESSGQFGEACQNCGNIAGPILPAVCPNCGFRDISPCPNCAHDIPRQDYVRLGSNLFKCPNCEQRVRLPSTSRCSSMTGRTTSRSWLSKRPRFPQHEVRRRGARGCKSH